jgi:hypothetical protein
VHVRGQWEGAVVVGGTYLSVWLWDEGGKKKEEGERKEKGKTYSSDKRRTRTTNRQQQQRGCDSQKGCAEDLDARGLWLGPVHRN